MMKWIVVCGMILSFRQFVKFGLTEGVIEVKYILQDGKVIPAEIIGKIKRKRDIALLITAVLFAVLYFYYDGGTPLLYGIGGSILSIATMGSEKEARHDFLWKYGKYIKNKDGTPVSQEYINSD